jgi:mono/diheme cytochrome c family protein
MPPLGDQMSDDEIAAAISYVRKQWGKHGRWKSMQRQ